MYRKIVIIAAALISACLAACGASSASTGNGSDGSAASQEGAAAGATDNVEEGTPEENAMAEGKISMYLDDGKMTVGIDEEHLPLMNMHNNEPAGPGIALITEMGKRLNTEVEIVNLKSSELEDAVGNTTDVIFVAASSVAEKTDKVDVTAPVYESEQAVLILADSGIEGREGLFGKVIGCLPGTEAELFIGDLGAEDGTTEKKVYDSAEEAVEDMLNGELDAFITRASTAQKLVEANQEGLSMIEGSTVGAEKDSYVFAIPKGDPILMEQLNEAIAGMQADGTIENIVSAE